MDDAGQHWFRPTGDSSISIAAEDASPRPTPLGPTPLGPTPLGESPETPKDSGAGSPNGCKAAAPGGDSPGPPPATRSADGKGASSRCSAPLLRLARQLRTLDQDPAWRRYADPTAPTPQPSTAPQVRDASRDASREALEQSMQALSCRLVEQGRPPLPQLVSADADKLARLHVLARMLSAELDRASNLKRDAVPASAVSSTPAPRSTAGPELPAPELPAPELRVMEPPESPEADCAPEPAARQAVQARAGRGGFAVAVALASAVVLLSSGVAVDRMVSPKPDGSQPRPTEIAAAPPREAAIHAPLAATTSRPSPAPHPIGAEIPPTGAAKRPRPPHVLRAMAPGARVAALPQAARPAPQAQRTAVGPPSVAASGSPAEIPAHPAAAAPTILAAEPAGRTIPDVGRPGPAEPETARGIAVGKPAIAALAPGDVAVTGAAGKANDTKAPAVATATPAAVPVPAPAAASPVAVAARMPASPPTRTAVSRPAPAPSAMPAPTAPIVVRFTGDAWIHVLDPTGKVVLSRLMHAGESWTPPAPGLLLTTGNAGATELVVNGVAAPPLGGTGTVLHLVPLDPAGPRRGTISSATAKPG